MELIGSLYKLSSKESMHLYYAVKERFGRKLDDRENFIIDTANKLKPLISDYKHIIIPESSNDFIEEVIKHTGIKYTIIHKNNIEFIKSNIDFMSLQKKEKEAHSKRIDEMGDSFKINALKPNQRRKYFDILFKKKKKEIDTIIFNVSFF